MGILFEEFYFIYFVDFVDLIIWSSCPEKSVSPSLHVCKCSQSYLKML